MYLLLTLPHVRSAKVQRKNMSHPDWPPRGRDAMFFPPLALWPFPPTGTNAWRADGSRGGPCLAQFPASTNGSLNLTMSGAGVISFNARDLLDSQRAMGNGAVNRFPLALVPASLGPFVPSCHHPAVPLRGLTRELAKLQFST